MKRPPSARRLQAVPFQLMSRDCVLGLITPAMKRRVSTMIVISVVFLRIPRLSPLPSALTPWSPNRCCRLLLLLLRLAVCRLALCLALLRLLLLSLSTSVVVHRAPRENEALWMSGTA